MRDNEFSAILRSGAERLAAAVNPPSSDVVRRRGNSRRRRKAVVSGVLAFAIGAGGGGAAFASFDKPAEMTPIAGASPAQTASPVASPSSGRPRIVAVTTGGAVEVLNSVTGEATATLASAGSAIGDSVSVSPSGAVYFSVRKACTDEIESVPVTGGPVTAVTTGVLAAVSPDGTSLAFVRGPDIWPGACQSSTDQAFQLVIRDLATGTERVYPVPPYLSVAKGGVPWPISHLSWASDNQSLLLSISSGQDNFGWDLVPVSPATSPYYLPANWNAGKPTVPVSGPYPESSPGHDYYYREGIYLPDGNLFVNEICCSGLPAQTTSSRLDVITPGGTLVRTVAIGFTNRVHSSFAADSSGRWLLYLSAHDLYLSGNGRPAVKLTSGLLAATWWSG
jgi:hypothetical protein